MKMTNGGDTVEEAPSKGLKRKVNGPRKLVRLTSHITYDELARIERDEKRLEPPRPDKLSLDRIEVAQQVFQLRLPPDSTQRWTMTPTTDTFGNWHVLSTTRRNL